ncbi:MAG: hypothetical protein D6725_04710, partial [Planctomycetota bacterium]
GNVAAAAEAAVQSERTRWQRRILVLTVTLVFPVVLGVIELFVRYAAGDRPRPVDPTRWLPLFTFLAVLQIPAALHCQRRLCRLEILTMMVSARDGNAPGFSEGEAAVSATKHAPSGV